MESSPAENFQLSAGYWNDNFQSVHIPPVLSLTDGDDDYVTASFWLQSAIRYPKRWIMIDVYLNILTNIEENYRTDLLTFRAATERPIGRATVQYGLGIMQRGNYGGAAIQNSYHRLMGYGQVPPPYLNQELAGFTGHIKYQYRVYSNRIVQSDFLSGSTVRTGGAPSKIYSGIEFGTRHTFNRLPVSVYGNIAIAYNHFFQSSRVLEPMFDSGITAGGLAGLTLWNHFQCGLWLIKNQYGQREPHFGIALSVNSVSIRPIKLSNGMFP